MPILNHKTKLILIFSLAIIIRLIAIASRPIWYDESFSLLISEKGPAAILSGTLTADANASAAEEHPPAYYFLLWGWMQVFGNSVTAARLLSILASLGALICIYLITRHLFDENTSLLATFLAGILPFQVHYAQEIRMYVFVTFWLALATYAFLKRQWILFSVAAALAQYTHNLAAIYLIPLALTPIFQREWKTLRSLTLAGLVSIVLYSPWLIHLPAQLAKVTSNFWVEKPGAEKIFTLFLYYLPHLPLSNAQLLAGLLLATLTITLASYQTFRARFAQGGVPAAEDGGRSNANKGLWLAYLAFFPPLLLWLISQFRPIYIERALLSSHAMFCIWLAWTITQTKLPRPIQIFSFVLVVTSASIGLYQHITYKGFPYAPSSALDQRLQSRFEQGDVIIHSNKLSYLPAFYFDRTLSQGFILDPVGGSTDTLSPATREILGLTHFENIEQATASAKRIWYIIYKQSVDEFKAQGLETHPDLEYLNVHFKLDSTEEWDDLIVYLYVRGNQ
jgi:4-amino-4-deoxy-L-arabinose transferase-like glycosyltransferase